MSKYVEAAPEGVPQDCWESACRAFQEMCAETEGADDRVIIARAILDATTAERERSAKVAMSFVRYSVTEHGTAANPYASAINIASAIRSGAELDVNTVRKTNSEG